MFSGVARLSGNPESNWVVAQGIRVIREVRGESEMECKCQGDGTWGDVVAGEYARCGYSDGKSVSPATEYIASLYWAVMTLTTVGYGDVSAVNPFEMVFSSIVMVCGAIFYALVLGSVTTAIEELSSSDQEQLDRVKKLDKFISRYNINSEMAQKLKQSIRLQAEWRTDFDDLFEACHPEFRAELLMEIHRPILIKTTFFTGIDHGFLKLIVGELKLHVCLAGDCVYRAGNDSLPLLFPPRLSPLQLFSLISPPPLSFCISAPLLSTPPASLHLLISLSPHLLSSSLQGMMGSACSY
jgi:hypothetical protein